MTEMQKPDPDTLRLVYDRCCELHRFFLTWRHQLLAGYFAILAALAVAFNWFYACDKTKPWAGVIWILGALATIFIWLLEGRNRELYRTCQNVASGIEEQWGFVSNPDPGKHRGLYLGLKGSNEKTPHSKTIDWMFGVALGLLLVAAITCFIIL